MAFLPTVAKLLNLYLELDLVYTRNIHILSSTVFSATKNHETSSIYSESWISTCTKKMDCLLNRNI